MARRLLILNGVAALMIPLHHAAAYGFSAMFNWGVDTPNLDALYSFAFWVTLTIRQLDAFAIPAFLFVSGYFVAFTTRNKMTWGPVAKRVLQFFWPFLIWTTFHFFLLGRFPQSFADFVSQYYYIPLLIQLYLMAPILSRIAHTHWKWLLLVTGLVQYSVMSLRYLQAWDLGWPAIETLIQLTPLWIFPARIFYFTFGVVVGIQFSAIKPWLLKNRRMILYIVVLAASLTLVEYRLVATLSGREWLGPSFIGIARTVYAILFLLLFLAYENFRLPGQKFLQDLGGKSLGLYLLNTPTIFVVSSLIFHLLPAFWNNQGLYQVALIVTGLWIPLFGMWVIRSTPLRFAYRYLFG